MGGGEEGASKSGGEGGHRKKRRTHSTRFFDVLLHHQPWVVVKEEQQKTSRRRRRRRRRSVALSARALRPDRAAGRTLGDHSDANAESAFERTPDKAPYLHTRHALIHMRAPEFDNSTGHLPRVAGRWSSTSLHDLIREHH
jgi:hypothetical protein